MDVRRTTLLILLAASCRAVIAQSAAAPDEPANEARPASQLLVLADGQIVSGHITPRPDGYDIQVAAGRLFINSDRVRFSAASLPDAYDRMRDSIPEFTPTNHLELARWCLGNRLYAQARREVLDALHLDPNRDDAKRMLRALEQVGERSNTAATGTGLTEYPSQVKIQRPAMETRSLAGLNRSVAHSFVRDVQPLLKNKCATSGCHGAGGKSQFQLASTHRGSTPAIAERNLAAVLKQIDFSNPPASPLLKVGEQAHGNMVSSAFPGRTGANQLSILQNWVSQAAHDVAPDAIAESAEQGGAGSELAHSGIRRVAAKNEVRGKVELLRMSEGAPGNPQARQLTTDDTDGKFLQDAKHANRRDAFSPDEYNRRYHGTAAENSAALSEQTQLTDKENIAAQVP